MVSDVLEQYDDVITFILPSLSKEKNSNEVSRIIIKHSALSLRITHRTELHMALVGK